MAEIGETVQIHLRGVLDSGRVIADTRAAGSPMSVKVGGNTLIPALEAVLCDMLPGDKRTFRLEPGRAFGAYDPSLVVSFPASTFPNSEALPIGDYIVMPTKIGALRAKVVSVNDAQVTLDCNHELAGEAITFDVEMLKFRRTSSIYRELHPSGCACGCDRLKMQLGRDMKFR